MQLHSSTMHAPLLLPVQTDHWRLSVSLAISNQEVRVAQRLRYRVFAQENGARLTNSAGADAGLDIEYFDAFCEHLLVHAISTSGDEQGHLVGTCRVLSPAAAQRAGGYYSETEFDLAPLQSLRAHTAELGRCCVDPAWRSTGVIMALWNELGLYMKTQSLQGLIGCASISLADGGTTAGRVWQELQTTHLVEPPWRARPFIPWLPTTAGTLPDSVGACVTESWPREFEQSDKWNCGLNRAS